MNQGLNKSEKTKDQVGKPISSISDTGHPKKEVLTIEPKKESIVIAFDVIKKYIPGIELDSKKDVDLSQLENDQILNLFHDLEKQNLFMFHGSPKERQEIVTVQQSRDSVNNMGAQNGVYASMIPEDALFYSFLDKDYFFNKIKNTKITFGVDIDEKTRKITLTLDQKSFELFKKDKDNFLKDSYLYLLDNSDFEPIPSKGLLEKISRNNHKPIITFKIPKKLADEMLIENETVIPIVLGDSDFEKI